MPGKIPLFDEMIQIATRDKLASDHPMRIKAMELKKLVEGNGMPEAKPLLGAWARARRAYCEYTKTPLVDEAVIETGAKLIKFLSGKNQ